MTRNPKLWAALSYVLGLFSGLVVLALLGYVEHESRDRFVRFHATQSVLAFSVVALLYVLLPTLPAVGNVGALVGIYTVAVAVLWVTLMVKALQGEAWRLPYIGDLAHAMSSK
jgi:uncharacterized membrane protein